MDGKAKSSAPQALDDAALAAVGGGYDVVFRDDGVNRDSWFVSIMTRRMVADSIRRELAAGGAVPEQILVGGRSFRVSHSGETYYVEEIRA